ncbi:glycoside hydrolase family 3 N-terminal domain-containing protein [Paracoccus shanxieyensis]|uniref:beta-N-acetylhexosaminidase n=1 Tax=Paracoccus shanxieyensis TaxID=2675752 RepID=A0A6L6IW80_9RHOB|nr:beta-hexosaminidase [Paracoccus shanxieyensis]MTH86597.1 beta-hexosaminidase [Paracoccus shanxieyensis]
MAGATILGGIAGPDLTPAERDFFRAADPWGFILFGRNIDTPDRLQRLTGDLRETLGRDAPILIDQEGGRVQRMRAPHWTDWAAPLDVAARGERAVWLHHLLLGQELRQMGIDADCAPVLDIARDDTHPFLRNRCLGTDAGSVARLGRVAADALLASGVLPIIKHMPGHGRARVDSHKDLPVVDAPLQDLLASDFAPFVALADLPMAMTAHIRFTAIDDAPATASAPVIALIRDTIGFDGLLMSDDIGMQALSGSMSQRAASIIAAGCDLVLSCNETPAQMEAIVTAAGAMTPQAARRAERALAMRSAPAPMQLAALRDELRELGALA